MTEETYYDPDRKIFWSATFRITEELMREERGGDWVEQFKGMIPQKKCDR